jgi:phosphopantothenoylcysteine decarboxylase/phosphopantothenate--cysteine ligase
MKCIVTAGPTYEELDEVRRLTNFSTGALGCGVADYLAERGHEVELLLGYYAQAEPALPGSRRQTFTTTADLRRRLEALGSPKVQAVFHAAAVSDFSFGKVWRRTEGGELREIKSAKISTGEAGLLAELIPAPKIIRDLRRWFPKALLVGWKYELEGSRAEALVKGKRQMAENQTDAVVVNGRAYGKGFGLVCAGAKPRHLPDRQKLYLALEGLLH